MTSKVHFVSLGCPKNLVDSQVMLGLLKSNQFELTENPETAETIIVNTCSFIDAAKRESIDMVLEMADYKKNGQLKNLVMSGCLAQRYSKNLEEEIPEVDLFIGTGEYHRIVELLQKKALGKLRQKSFVDIPKFIHTEEHPRINTNAHHSAYLKISEGCARRCSFCIIPKLRGGEVRSRTVASLVEEAKSLVAGGVSELMLVAQDLTHYGKDRNYEENLADLLRALVKIEGLRWIRLHYAYPDNLSDEVIDLIASEEKIAKYIDMPIQHANDAVLKLMNRSIRNQTIRELVAKLRKKVPGIVIRTNLIVGHPGETEEAFEDLKKLVQDLAFDRLGVFQYSLEEDTGSYRLAQKIGEIPQAVIANRYSTLMALQQKISLQKNRQLLGKRLTVLVEGPSAESELLLQGRWQGQATEIDGMVLINEGSATAGEYVEVEIRDALPYDLVGGIVARDTTSAA